MPRRKQINLIISISVVLISAILFLFFSPQESKKIVEVKDKEIVPSISSAYDREVLGSNVSATPLPPTELVQSEDFQIADEVLYEVVKVVDGDTIDVNINGEIERLRLIGIDTPETVDPRKEIQCFGLEASNKAKELLLGKFVLLESDETQGERDKYRRLLRYVFLPDGTNFNLFMIQEGYAYEYTYDEIYKYQGEFKNAQIYAEENQKGLWNKSICPK